MTNGTLGSSCSKYFFNSFQENTIIERSVYSYEPHNIIKKLIQHKRKIPLQQSNMNAAKILLIQTQSVSSQSAAFKVLKDLNSSMTCIVVTVRF